MQKIECIVTTLSILAQQLENVNQLAELKDLEGCCGIKLFVGSSTGNLLVALEEDIDKVFKIAQK